MRSCLPLVVTSALAGDGKSTVAAGLADALASRGYRVQLTSGGDLASSDADVVIREHDDPATAVSEADLVVLVVRQGQADDATLERAAAESGAAAIVMTSVPEEAELAARARLRAITTRLDGPVTLVGVLPQDRLLAAPSLEQVATALEASLDAPEGAGNEAVEWIEIGPITAHPGSVHFATVGSKAIVTRGDRPDVALRRPRCRCGVLDSEWWKGTSALCSGAHEGGRGTFLIATALTTSEGRAALGSPLRDWDVQRHAETRARRPAH